MSNYKADFPELHQYLGGLFHQDWKDVFDWKEQSPDHQSVVRYFKIRNKLNPSRVELEELKKFLSLKLNESETEDVMAEWNIGYSPYGVNSTYIKWLNDILEVLEEPLEKTRKEFIPEFIG